MVLAIESTPKNIKVFFRILPTDTHNPWESVKILDDKKHLYVRCLQDYYKGKETPLQNYWKFQTDGVFLNSSQSDVFDEVTDGIFEGLFYGTNAVILAYGQTGSGKTLTTSALQNGYEDRGLLPRVVEHLFSKKNALTGRCKISIQLKYVEVNRTFLRNLLSENDNTLYDMTTYQEVQSVKAKSLFDALKLLFIGESNKTFKNEPFYQSNMASSIVTITITMKYTNRSELLKSNLHIVDLCGLDTIGNFSCIHKNGYEVGSGNLAKSQLEQFMLVLNAFNQTNIVTKQRLCIVVNYLRDALNRQSIIRLIGHIRIPDDDLKITLSMLKFGCLVKGLSPQKLATNTDKDPVTEVQQLEQKLSNMKKQQELNSMLQNTDLTTNLSMDRHDYTMQLAGDYLNGKLGESDLLNTSNVFEAMKIFKELYNKIELERNELSIAIKSRDIDDSTIKTKESSFSKKSKYSSHTTGGSSRSKKSASVKKAKDNKPDNSSVNSKEASLMRFSQHSKDPGPPRHSGGSARYTKKKKKSSESVPTRSETESYGGTMLPQLPEFLPSNEEAWVLFNDDADISKLNEQLITYDKHLDELHKLYNESLVKLNESTDVLVTRRDEMFKFNLLKDLQEPGLDDTNSMNDLEQLCTTLLRTAEMEWATIKESLLTIQAELKLVLDYKSKTKAEISRKYREFCQTKYNIQLPVIEPEEVSQIASVQSENASKNEEASVLEQIEVPAINILKYQELQKLLAKLIEKRIKNKIRNQKWIQTCKLEYH